MGLREWSATVAFTGTSAVEYKYVVCKADHVRWEVRLSRSKLLTHKTGVA